MRFATLPGGGTAGEVGCARWLDRQPIGAALMPRWRWLRARQGSGDHRAKNAKLKARLIPRARQQYRHNGIHIGVVKLGDLKQLAQQRDGEPDLILVG
jgi:hypothetical protein